MEEKTTSFMKTIKGYIQWFFFKNIKTNFNDTWFPVLKMNFIAKLSCLFILSKYSPVETSYLQKLDERCDTETEVAYM